MTVFTLAARPAEGTLGTRTVAVTNCFRLSVVRTLAFHHYHAIKSVSSNKEVNGVARRRQIITNLYVRDHPTIFQPGQVVFDGKAGLFTSKDLGLDRDLHFEVHGSHEEGTSGSVRVQLQNVGLISESDFDALTNWQHHPETALTAKTILNLLLQNSTPSEFRKVMTRNAMFSMSDKRALIMGLLFVRGCFASVRLAREHLLLNVDVCSAIMYESTGLKDIALMLLELSDVRQLSREGNIHRLLSLLKRVRVKQVVAGKVGRVRTIRDIVARAGFEEFDTHDGTRITVAEYFSRIHGYRLQYPDLPGIRVIKKDRNNENTDRVDIIPFELLEVIEGQFYRRRLNQRVHQEIHKMSKMRPENRKQKIQEYLQAFNPSALQSAGLHVDRGLLTVKGRILRPPAVAYASFEQTPKEGVWNLPSRDPTSFWKPCTIRALAVLSYELACNQDFTLKFLERLVSNLQFYGVDFLMNNNQIVTHRENPQGNKRQHLASLKLELERVVGRNFSLEDLRNVLVLVILPGGGKSVLYEEIKTLGDTEAGEGLITQCLSWDILKIMNERSSSMTDKYLSNIALKINVKMGGVNFVPREQGLEWIHNPKDDAKTMVIGLDVSHPGPGVMRPSMAAMVYSVDQFASKYFTICSMQPPRVEFIPLLRSMIKVSLLRFRHHVRREHRRDFLPSRLLIYRDGLSDGELANVGRMEIEAIRDGIRDAWNEAKETKKAPADEVPITYVVVGKRHHIRFFPEKGDGDQSKNCKSGFVTDDPQITSPHVYDFFLQSHAGLIGTSRPAHYMVLRDENGLTSDELQSITFGLCHTLARATRAVSLPAPVYYAHLACKRANIHIEFKDNQSLPTSTDSRDTEFNEEDWRFYGVNRLQSKLMYYA